MDIGIIVIIIIIIIIVQITRFYLLQPGGVYISTVYTHLSIYPDTF